MPDLFLGAAAGLPGLPDWIDHAFPVPVKHGPAYLAMAEQSLRKLLNPNIQADEKRAYNVAYLLVYF